MSLRETEIIADEVPSSITSCNCSFCNRVGALWAYFNLNNVEIHSESDLIDTYSWGEKAITYHRCGTCGCATHYTAPTNDGGTRIAINCRMASLSEISNIPIRQFDGRDTWKYLDEWYAYTSACSRTQQRWATDAGRYELVTSDITLISNWTEEEEWRCFV